MNLWLELGKRAGQGARDFPRARDKPRFSVMVRTYSMYIIYGRSK